MIYQYNPSRSGDVAHTFLRGYQGVVQTDGYSGYNFLDDTQGVIHIGCWAHARRKFMEAYKAHPKKGKPGSTQIALNYIQTLYRVEKKAKKLCLTGQDLLELRRKESLSTLQKFRAWL